MKLFRRKKHYEDLAEQRFEQVLSLVKDLDRNEYKKLKAAMDLAWEGYNKIRQVQTIDEKENSDIDVLEKSLEKAGR